MAKYGDEVLKDYKIPTEEELQQLEENRKEPEDSDEGEEEEEEAEVEGALG